MLAEGVRDYEYGTSGEYRWLRCDGCGLVRLDPFPSPGLLERAYPSSYHAYATPRSSVTRWFLERSRAGLARAMVRRLPTGGTVLDVGCSSGLLLAEIGKLGDYELLGVELKAEAADAAQSRGIEVWRGDVQDAPFAVASVDLILLQHVLEHVFDPIAMLRTVHGLLKPGGRVCGEVPNLDCWDFRLFGRTWGGGHAPRHLWHLTPATLRRALSATGFDDVVVRPSLHTGHWALSVQNWLRRKHRDAAGLRSGRAWYFPPLLVATIPVNALQMVLFKTGVMRFEATRPFESSPPSANT